MNLTKQTTYSISAIILVVIALFLFKSVFSTPDSLKKEAPIPVIETYRVQGGWGYSILVENKIIIKQDIIPAVQSNSPFQTKEDAQKTGEWVLKKILKKERPTINVFDLDSMHISFQKNKSVPE